MGKKNKVTVIGAHPATARDADEVVADVAIGPVTLRDVRFFGTCDGSCVSHDDANEHSTMYWAGGADLDDNTKARMLAALEVAHGRLQIVAAYREAAAIIEAANPGDGNAMNIRTTLAENFPDAAV